MDVGFVDKVMKDIDRLKLGEGYGYVRFILAWVLFETWIKEHSTQTNTAGALDWFRANNNDLKSVGDDFWKTSYVSGLASAAKAKGIQIGRWSNKHDANLNDKADIAELLFQVRNAFIHGDLQINWSAQTAADHSVIDLARNVAEKWLTTAYAKGMLK